MARPKNLAVLLALATATTAGPLALGCGAGHAEAEPPPPPPIDPALFNAPPRPAAPGLELPDAGPVTPDAGGAADAAADASAGDATTAPPSKPAKAGARDKR
jgi:hypothetical protein